MSLTPLFFTDTLHLVSAATADCKMQHCSFGFNNKAQTKEWLNVTVCVINIKHAGSTKSGTWTRIQIGKSLGNVKVYVATYGWLANTFSSASAM